MCGLDAPGESDHQDPNAPRRRGRPKNADRANLRRADEAIGLTVWQLLAWGYPLRRAGGVADVVGTAAAEALKRVDHAGRALGPDRIEQIFKGWMRTARRQSGWFKHPVPYDRPWTGAVVSWLRATGPRNVELPDIARALLLHGGVWEGGPLPRYVGDAPPTAKRQKELRAMPRMRWDDGDETG